jgi:NAD(P)-dependent dehydrogenase (short-subunit alcohol dehydrogenase family)
MGLNNKVAVINGGGLGIGRSTCLLLAEAGADIAIVDNISERAENVAREVSALKRKALPIHADVLSEAGVDRMIKAVLAEFGTIDILVNIIGNATWKPVFQMTEEEWDLDHHRNLKYVWLNAKAAAKMMIDQEKKGCIINISSMSGTTASPGCMAYGAAKAGLIQLTKSMAIAWGEYGIRVNCVTAGGTRTPRVIQREKDIPAEKLQARNKTLNALGRMAETEEIAGAILCLASDLCSYVTGQSLQVDGGSMIESSRSQIHFWL